MKLLSTATIRGVLLLLASSAAACGSGLARPAALDTAQDQCAYCRMIVSDARLASQLVAPYEEPRFFDDLGCLSSYLSQQTLPRGAVAYVADHRTKQWVRADAAVYTRVNADTAMGSHILAHESAASRDGDPQAAGGTPLEVSQVFGGRMPPGGS